VKQSPEEFAREIHHRVKNNLQIIASILRLQMRRQDSPAAQEALADAIHRILGMVQVHDLLSRAEAEEVELRELLERILELDIQTFLLPGQVIRHEVRGERRMVAAGTAASVALAVNELVINALKHAFPGRKEGRVDIELTGDGVIVADDGVGLPPSFTLVGSANLGLRLVQSIVREDLKGAIELRSEGGTRVALRFPSPA
jgi:two-component sensor histidine kinase